jgi:hypothetical protein
VKKIKYILYILIITIILNYAYFGFIDDISMNKAVINNNSKPIYLITYADGEEYFYRNQNIVARYGINKNIDFILNYKKSIIDPEFQKNNKFILDRKLGAGLWLWKPYIIYETLKNSEEGSIIVYLDSAFKIKKDIKNFLDHIIDNDILLIHDHDRKNGAYIKGDSFALMNCDNESCRNFPLIFGGMIIVKNTELSRKFILNWLNSMQNLNILEGGEYIKKNYPEYLWHHFDQSVLSLVYHNNKEKVKLIEWNDILDYFIWFHRKPSKSSPSKHYYSIYGSDPLINFNKQGKSLPSTSLLNIPPIVYIRKKIIELMN